MNERINKPMQKVNNICTNFNSYPNLLSQHISNTLQPPAYLKADTEASATFIKAKDAIYLSDLTTTNNWSRVHLPNNTIL